MLNTATLGPMTETGILLQARPLLPRIVLLMSVPLYLGYAIKHGLVPGVVFAFLYSWSIVSFVLVPWLCVAECALLVRAWRREDPRRASLLRWHGIGLGSGVLAVLATFAVR
jgi:ABC-type Mn2+/Zn2+ transport system permease subunit